MQSSSLAEQAVDSLFELITSPVDAEQPFASYAKTLSESSELDSFFGGLFETASQRKALRTNAQVAECFAIAANLYANSDYARIALQALGYLMTYHKLSEGLFATETTFSQPLISISTLKTNLDDSQWQALKCYFDLPDQGDINWTALSVVNQRGEIHQLTDLHPKQVPLALDGALQILQFQMPGPTTNPNWTIENNLIFCRALFTSGIYLNQQEKVEIAEQLLTQLMAENDYSQPALWLDVLLLRLRHNWDDTLFAKAVEICINQDDLTKAEISRAAFINYNRLVIQSLLAIKEPAKSRDVSYKLDLLTAKFAGIVMITGPAHFCRQWLQRLDNQIQHKYCYFAIPDEHPIQAQLYPVTGSPVTYTDLDELYSLQQ